METKTDALTELRERLRTVADLDRAAAVLGWDQEVNMPPGGLRARASQLSTLARLAHEHFTAPELGEVLASAEAATAQLPYESDERSLVRVTRRDYEQATRLPVALVAELAEVSTSARPVWLKARAENDWASFAPVFANNVRLHREVADALGWKERRYDALINSTEPGLTTAALEGLFEELKAVAVPLVAEVADRDASDHVLFADVPPERQVSFAYETCIALGFDPQRGRQDLSAHPFCSIFSVGDVRLTTRTTTGFANTLYSSIHEIGHGLYDQGVDPALDGTRLDDGATAGFHESQSRLWENLVGRSRAFAEWLVPRLRRDLPAQYADVDADSWYKALNLVRPTFIRVDADELTYNLHILLRFELENLLIDGDLAAADVPEAWNARMREYLGVEPPTDTDGALQDIHWSGLGFGSFPSYTLGNVIGAQLMEVIRRQLPDLDDQIARGEFEPLLDWLRTNVYRHGRKLTPSELLVRITGEDLNARAWIDYARRKFSA
ncbi:MAG TPA: carboxypeptidase M32 [Candidatus Dormibacteraeota bacterium]